MVYRHTGDSQLNQIQFGNNQKQAAFERRLSAVEGTIIEVDGATSPVSVGVPSGTVGAALIASDTPVSVAVSVEGDQMTVTFSTAANVKLRLF